MQKKILFLIILLPFLVMIFWLIQKKQSPKYTEPMNKITLAAYEGEASLLVYLAEAYGFFKQNGLDVTIRGFDSGKAAADDLIIGEADISTNASGVLVSNGFDYPNLQVLATIATLRVQGFIVRKDKGILTVGDLIGKKIGVTRKSHGEFNLGIFLLINGLSISDVEIVDLSPSKIVDAMISGEIDAGFTWEPNLYNIKNKLADNALVWKNGVPEFKFILLSKKEWLDNNSSVATRFVKSIIEAEEYVKKNQDDSKKFLEKRFNYKQSYAISTWQDHDFDVTLSQELLLEFEDIARWQIENNLTTATIMPNYLNYIYFDSLEAIKPEVVQIIR
jgi:ABC-type nitrate/sulfonate/bicarbonate transport system substrate-binding protein